jgi:hypothetical protein
MTFRTTVFDWAIEQISLSSDFARLFGAELELTPSRFVLETAVVRELAQRIRKGSSMSPRLVRAAH